MHNRRNFLAATLGMALLVTPVSDKVRAAAPGGWQSLTAGELTAEWWKWLLGLPVSQSPAFDDTGANAFNGQPFSGLLFLSGTFRFVDVGGDEVSEVTRSISVKQGTALFFPLINTEWDEICFLPGTHFGKCSSTPPAIKSIPQLRSFAQQLVDNASQLNVTLTPTDANFNQSGDAISGIDYSRIQSPVFNYRLPKTDNLDQNSGVEVSGTIAPAVSDGYWSLVTADKLQAGHNYLLQFGGQLPNFREIITYKITVTAP